MQRLSAVLVVGVLATAVIEPLSRLFLPVRADAGKLRASVEQMAARGDCLAQDLG